MAELKPVALALLLAVSAPALAQQAAPGEARPNAAASGSPTDVLFDAIAVGNAEAVRDAVARGANLNARNVLGQRPVDFAIDVGRSDIAFTLLSLMRAGAPERPAAAPVAPPRPAAGRTAGATIAAPAPPRTPTLWANDGGAAQPGIGFLGFDASRPDGARPPTRTRP
jgi:hypothetical protein